MDSLLGSELMIGQFLFSSSFVIMMDILLPSALIDLEIGNMEY